MTPPIHPDCVITTMGEQVDFAYKLQAELKKNNRPEKDLHLMNCIITTLEYRLEVERKQYK